MDKSGPEKSSRHPVSFFLTILPMLSAICVLSCMTPHDHSSGNEQGDVLELTRVSNPTMYPSKVPAGRYIFNNREEWSGFWSRYHEAPAPVLDLQNFTLAVVFLGRKPNPGYSVEIVNAAECRNRITIEVIEYLPSPGMMYAQVIVYPYDVVLIPKMKKTIDFITSEKTGR
jgi:hypothetical protein